METVEEKFKKGNSIQRSKGFFFSEHETQWNKTKDEIGTLIDNGSIIFKRSKEYIENL